MKQSTSFSIVISVVLLAYEQGACRACTSVRLLDKMGDTESPSADAKKPRLPGACLYAILRVDFFFSRAGKRVERS